MSVFKIFLFLEEGEIESLLPSPALTLKDDDETSEKSFENHPYKHLLNFQPTSEQMSRTEVNFPKSINQTPLCDITKKEDIENLITDLKNQKEIGVDVEYSDHGYKAITCLVQISTNEKDYIIDAIALKDDLHVLNAIFTNPNIVKIFHSSQNDLKWLQQDLGLFVVNLFDTQKAMRALNYKKLGLDELLNDFGVVKDKAMQRQDFRKRPLPPKYKDYARTDSHYLITFYHKLKNELIESNSLRQVFRDCNNACKKVFETVDDQSYVSVVSDLKENYERQLQVLEKLNKWRHGIAEYLDLNVGKILSKNNMKNLVLQMPTNPNEIKKIAASSHVDQHLDKIVEILSGASPVNRFSAFRKNKRQFNQTDFGRSEIQGPSKSRKRNWKGNQGVFLKQNKRNVQNDFDLRNTLGGRPTSGRGKRPLRQYHQNF